MQELLPRHEEHEVFYLRLHGQYLRLGNCSCVALLQAVQGLMQYQHSHVHVSNAGAIAEVFLRALRVFVVLCF